MDFQSRINSFRQGLNDQQSNYNKLASNMSQMGRTLLPDREAARLEFHEKVGGTITGMSAGIHGGAKLAKKVQKYRKSRQAKANNQTTPEDSTSSKVKQAADDTAERTGTEQSERTLTQSANTPSEMDRLAKNPADLAETDRGGTQAASRGADLGKLNKEMGDPFEEEGGGATQELAESSVKPAYRVLADVIGKPKPQPQQVDTEARPTASGDDTSIADQIAKLQDKKPISGEASEEDPRGTIQSGS